VIASTRRRASLAALALTAALAALAMAIGTSHVDAASYTECSMSAGLKYNPNRTKPTYHLKLWKKNTSCTTAKKVMKSYHACRRKNSVVCNEKVRNNWTCTASRTSSNDQRFNAKFTCRWGDRRVKSTYQQRD